MRKLLLCTSLLLVTVIVNSQETAPAQPPTKQDYLLKSKNQKTAAWVLLGVGVALVAIAAPGDVSFDTLPVLVIGSGAAILGSITLFLAAGKNKRRAEAMTGSLQVRSAPVATSTGLFDSSLPRSAAVLNPGLLLVDY